MFNLTFNRRSTDCEGTSRRDFLKVGTLGLGALTLPELLRARAEAKSAGSPTKETSVIWLWLGGGPTHVETFDPKMSAPSEYRSVTGEVATAIPGVTIGGTLPKIALVADKMAFVRSFAHTNSGHGGGTHFVMTGYDNKKVDNGGLPTKPSLGSITARARGANNPRTGMPNYVRLGGIGADGPAFLGPDYMPFDPAGKARQNMTLTMDRDRFEDRRSLLKSLDGAKREMDSSGMMEGLDAFEQQAFNLIVSTSQDAFDLKSEDPKVVARYGTGLGQQLLKARRLCEAGVGFVTISYGGWDMHGQIESAMKSRSPQLDHAVATLVQDLAERSMLDNVLLVITGEFGRTPKVNKNAGRDHWAMLSTLGLAGGGLRMGQTVGESMEKVDYPKSKPVTPQDLMATVFHVLGIDQKLQVTNNQGRPTYMLENGKPIPELI